MHSCKLTKDTLKILRCERRKTFKVCLAFYNIMHERVKLALWGNNQDLLWKIRACMRYNEKRERKFSK